MIGSRLARALGFGLSLFATAISSVASSATLVLCAEPDGCVELEVFAPGQGTLPACGGHEHEVPATTQDDVEELGPCPCRDTVIATSADNLRPEKSKSWWANGSETMLPHSSFLQIAVVRNGFEPSNPDAHRLPCRARHSQRSVVLRI